MNLLYLISAKSPADFAYLPFDFSQKTKIYLCAIEYGCEQKVEALAQELSRKNIPYQLIAFVRTFSKNNLNSGLLKILTANILVII